MVYMTKGQTMKKITLDVAFDEGLAESMALWGEKCPRVWMRMVELSGPAGGWPVVEFIGEEADLREWLIEFGMDEDDADMTLFDADEI